MRLDGAAADPAGALARLAGGRLRQALLKRGARGGLRHDFAAGRTEAWEARAGAVVDSTGAGDAFAGGVLSGLLAGEDLTTSIERGVVSASFALEGWGAAGLLAATSAGARRRRGEWYGSRTNA
jgi:ribokinase